MLSRGELAIVDWMARQPRLFSLASFGEASKEAIALRILGGNVRPARVKHQLTQQKLADLADLNVRTISKIEAGQLNIRPHTLKRIQRAIGCSFSELLEINTR